MSKKRDFASAHDQVDSNEQSIEWTKSAREAVFGRNVDKLLSLNENKTLKFGRFEFLAVGLSAPMDISVEEWIEVGEILLQAQGAIQWWLGDWANLYRDIAQWGNKYQELAEKTGFDERTLANYAWVAREIQLSSRDDKLTFSHHRAVAGRADYQDLLRMAAEKNWSVRQLMAEVKEREQIPDALQSAKPALADKVNQLAFKRIWQSVEKGTRPTQADIDHLRAWLQAIENMEN